MHLSHRTAANAAAFTSAALLLLTLSLPVAAANEGQLAFNNHCRTCHSTRADDNRLGPTLSNVVGRKAGSVPDYHNYSQSLKGSGITWDEATLDAFIENPDKVAAGNNMKPYAGITDPAVRKQIVEFLKSKGSG